MVTAAALLSWFLVGLQAGLLRNLHLGKEVRQDGPASHLNKSGTPSMGGVAFTLAAVVVYYLGGADAYQPVLLLVGFGLLGLADDLAGLAARPLRAREKIAVQFLLAIVFAAFVGKQVQYTTWPWLDFVLIVLAVVGYANAFNFTDGLDGLAASVTAVILLPLVCCWPGSSWAPCSASSGTTPPRRASSWATPAASCWGPWSLAC